MTAMENQFDDWKKAMLAKYPEAVVAVIMRNISKGPDGWSIFNHGVRVMVEEYDALARRVAVLEAALAGLNGRA